MKAIRNFAAAALLAVTALGASTLTSCNSDKCKDVVCQNSGTCTDGNCVCTTGYEGATCQTEVATKFVGTYAVKEVCGSTPSNDYTITITKTGKNTLLVENLGNYLCTIGGNIVYTGTTTASTTFTINDTKCDTKVVATGSISADGKTITIPYTATYGNPTITDNCTATLTRQ